MPSLTEQTAYNERLARVLRAHNLDPAQVRAGTEKLWTECSTKYLGVTLQIKITDEERELILYGVEPKGDEPNVGGA